METTLTTEMIDEIVRDTLLLEGSDKADQQKFRTSYLEPLDIVDDNGDPLGIAPRGLAHRLGLRHVVVYCLVKGPSGEWLLQVRRGGRLDISVGGHVIAGEYDYEEALAREFWEELGFELDRARLQLHVVYNRDAPLSQRKPLTRNRERRHVYLYEMSTHEVESLREAFGQRLSADEVTSFAWFHPDAVREGASSSDLADGLAASLAYL